MLDREKTREKKKEEGIGGKCSFKKRFQRRIREVTSEQRLERSPSGYWRKSILGRGSSQCEGPKVGVCLVRLRKRGGPCD